MEHTENGARGARNLLLTLRYRGDRFHGSAVQKNAVTVQGVLQPAVERITGGPVMLKCCSRTDAGVHADMFCVSFKTGSAIPCGRLVRALNASLPEGAAVYACRPVPQDFHARYSCAGKRYVYRIYNSPVRNPFYEGFCCRVPYPLDAGALAREAADFVGRHDFAAFCAAGSSVQDTVRTLSASTVRREGSWVLFEVQGDGFLYNMVRIMAGTLLDIASGKRAVGSIPEILSSRDRARAGRTAPPQGLFLAEVFYGDLDPLDEASVEQGYDSNE